MSAVAAFPNPFAGALPVMTSLRRGLGQAGDGLKRLREDTVRAGGGMNRFAAGLRTAAAPVRALGTGASGAAGSVRRIQRSRAVTGVRRIGTAAGRARTAAGLEDLGMGGGDGREGRLEDGKP